jgi:APA family basic amino acid/polyamine antiporter
MAPEGALERRLGPADAASVVISNVIGVGIFTTPGIVAAMVPHPAAMLAVWAVGGLLAFAGACAYAELASEMPRAGGEYVYLRRAYGPLAAFLTGWTSFVAGFSGAIAFGAVGLAVYLGRFFPQAADQTPIWQLSLGIISLTISPRAVVAIAVIAALALLHMRGLGPGRWVQNTLAALKVVALVAIIGFGLGIGHGSMSHLSQTAPVAATSWLFALIPVMFSYSGWNAAAYIAEEIRDPQRNVPIALAAGTGIVIVIYLALNVLYLYALPITDFGGVKVGETAVHLLLGPVATNLLSALTIVIIVGSISAMTFVGPRVYYAMARDGLFFASAGRVHSRYHTPAGAIAAQAAWSSVLVLSGSFEQLLAYTGFAVVLFAGIAVSSLFIVRRTRRETPTFRTWGYPIAPGVFVAASLLIVLNAVREDPLTCGAGLLVIAAGIPLYFWLVRSRRSAPVPAKPAVFARPSPAGPTELG